MTEWKFAHQVGEGDTFAWCGRWAFVVAVLPEIPGRYSGHRAGRRFDVDLIWHEGIEGPRQLTLHYFDHEQLQMRPQGDTSGKPAGRTR